MGTVGVAIPSIPNRRRLLERALRSVEAQTRAPDDISVVIDKEGRGAAVTRNRAWRALDTDWVAFLDDDDEFEPHHLEELEAAAELNDADMVYPWFTVVGGRDPFPMHFKQPWNPDRPRQTTITCLWKRSALEEIDGFPEPAEGVSDDGGNRVGEDFLAVCALNSLGGKILHLPKRTWKWHHHSRNTSGRPWRRWAGSVR